jgi:transposase
MMMEGNNEKKEEIFVLRPLNHKQLAQMYGVSWLTFQNWIKKVEKEVGKKTGHFYHVPQVRKIFQLFGIPKQFSMTVNEIEEIFRS